MLLRVFLFRPLIVNNRLKYNSLLLLNATPIYCLHLSTNNRIFPPHITICLCRAIPTHLKNLSYIFLRKWAAYFYKMKIKL